MNLFNVGDILIGIENNPYRCTGSNVLVRITHINESEDDAIKVILCDREGHDVGDGMSFWVRSKYFTLLEKDESNIHRIYCPCCHQRISEDDETYTYSTGNVVHKKCSERVKMCAVCGEPIFSMYGYIYLDESVVCTDCIDTLPRCIECGSHFMSESELTDGYCSGCYTSPEEMAIKDDKNDYIRDYQHNHKQLEFYGTDPDAINLYFGLEIEFSGEQNRPCLGKWSSWLDSINTFFKHDSSLCEGDNEGCEVAYAPATFDFLKNDGFKMREMLEDLKEAGQDAGHSLCGMHIHVSRSFFRKHGIDDLESESRIISIVGALETDLKRISDRYEQNSDSSAFYWCKFDSIREIFDEAEREETCYKAQETLRNVSRSKDDVDRYQAVNIIPRNTIEFRFFAGTSSFNTILKRVKLINEICQFAVNHNIVECLELKSISDLTKKEGI